MTNDEIEHLRLLLRVERERNERLLRGNRRLHRRVRYLEQSNACLRARQEVANREPCDA